MSRLRVRQVILVEGRYDAAALAGLVDGLILTTGGFSIFKDEEQKALIRRLGRQRGLLILTDSDAAGFAIRHYIEKIAAGCEVLHAYIPAVPGREKRKSAPGKEGTLGVEGLPPDVLRAALLRASAGVEDAPKAAGRAVDYTDLYAWGLSGGSGSAARRRALLRRLGLPGRLSKKAMVAVLNSLYTREELERIMAEKPVLFWDFHGTLSEPDILWFDAVRHAAAAHCPDAPPVADEVLRLHFGGRCLPWFEVPSGDTRHLAGSEAWWAFCEEAFVPMLQNCGYTEEQARRMAPAMRETILQPRHYRLQGDAVATLQELQRRGYRSFVLSNNFPELADIIAALGLAPYFEGVLVSGQIGYEKPRREIFEAAREAAGQPADVWMIGDSVHDDIEGGKAAGFTTVQLGGERSGDADYYVAELGELLGILG